MDLQFWIRHQKMKWVLLRTLNKHLILEISRDYGVLLEDAGHTLRGLFIIDPKGIIRQITINDLPVGRYVFNTLTPFTIVIPISN